MEFGGAVHAGAPIRSEDHLAIDGVDVPTLIAWLDGIEAALRELRRYVQDKAAIDEASTIAQQLRAEITVPQPRIDVSNKLWQSLLAIVTFYPA
jgi:hypothetical protein